MTALNRYSAASFASVLGLLIFANGCHTSDWEAEMAKRKRLEKELAASQEKASKRLRRIGGLMKDLDKVKAQLAATQATLGSLGSKLSERQAMLKKQQAEMERQMRELARNRMALTELARIKAEMARQKALNDKLRGAFTKMISAGRLKLINRRGKLVIQMKSNILFSSGKAKLTPEGTMALTELANILKTIKRHFQVAGHTDNVPTSGRKYKDNWALSGHRSTVVARLLHSMGVPGRNLSASGFAEFDPLAANDTPEGRASNRRIEIMLLPAVKTASFGTPPAR